MKFVWGTLIAISTMTIAVPVIEQAPTIYEGTARDGTRFVLDLNDDHALRDPDRMDVQQPLQITDKSGKTSNARIAVYPHAGWNFSPLTEAKPTYHFAGHYEMRGNGAWLVCTEYCDKLGPLRLKANR